ncbi:uncharacterized protein LOC121426864 [Lytechinus variegatus]|uniref:uncharacterized protein LOC121426864 n=1 Tax=Lytechinus variegatus TaxID=7654 RepID=UPI001BB182A8|nr:uncharacterized protein LOC121426864 [Lytechinus variegatus]
MMGPSTSGFQDPQILAIESLGLQRSLDNSFSQRGQRIEASAGDEELSQKLNQFVDTLNIKLKEDGDSFRGPLTKFAQQIDKLQTDSALISALVTFGKYSGYAGAKLVKRPGLQTSTKIGVQPTAVSRRKAALGGRRALITGRPLKISRKEHGYAKIKKHSYTVKRGVLPSNDRPATHSLSHCVASNVALGKRHSAGH